MEPMMVCRIDGRKFMWDGELFPSREAAENQCKEYRAKGFETHLIEDNGQVVVYTRRVVTEAVPESNPQTP